MRLLLSKGINPKNNLNFALCRAAEYGELELVEKLILLGSDDFNSPVIMAAEYSNTTQLPEEVEMTYSAGILQSK